jgi:hypothetical protein
MKIAGSYSIFTASVFHSDRDYSLFTEALRVCKFNSDETKHKKPEVVEPCTPGCATGPKD